MIDAIVLAGGVLKEALTDQGKEKNKAFIKIEGKTLLEYILEALEESILIDRVIVVGPEKDLETLKKTGLNFIIVSEMGGMLENLAAAFEAGSKEGLFLITTADIPLVTSKDINYFIKNCEPLDNDLYYPVVKREVCLTKYPNVERTYVKLKDGHMTGGNICLVRSGWFLGNRQRLELFVSYRKKPLKLLRILPPLFIIKFLFKLLSISDLENYLSRQLNLSAKAFVCDIAEIAVDVDKKSDLTVVKKAMSERSK